ncbi:MAG TPA: Wzz/FepE/Etk N-terminal domain-containing protein [Terriglobia bacterium]|nr:Wzz/FepE/Etk N-terminal domain-containing protein [Terriglobia bacterium]
MVGGRELGFDDYMKILRRRLRVILIPALAGALLGYLVTLFLTPEYTSTSLILIERPAVPESVVPTATTTDDLFTRLATMEEQILSRTRLQPLIERYDLFKTERKKSMEDAVDDMRKGISVKPEEFASSLTKNSRQQPVPGFAVSFTSESPRLAQQVCTELTSMFMFENQKQHEDTARGTTEFISNQLAEAKRQLDEQDAKLAEFKRKNMGALPDEEQANLQMLGVFSSQLAAVGDQINRAQQDKAYEQSLLAQQEAAWEDIQSGRAQPNANALEGQLLKLKDALQIAQGRYTDDYPDVVKLKADIAQLERQIADQKSNAQSTAPNPAGKSPAAPDASAPPSTSHSASSLEAAAQDALSSSIVAGQTPAATGPPARTPSGALAPASIQQLRAQLKQLEMFVAAKTKQQQKLQEQVRVFESRLQISPSVEQEYNQLALGHVSALKFYNSLLTNRDQSQMSLAMETESLGELFKVLDSADLPQEPSFPIWWEFALGGLGAGLLVGAAVAGIYEARDKAIRDERDVEFAMELPTLALVPTIGSGNGKRRGLFGRKPKQPALPASPAHSITA